MSGLYTMSGCSLLGGGGGGLTCLSGMSLLPFNCKYTVYGERISMHCTLDPLIGLKHESWTFAADHGGTMGDPLKSRLCTI
jgi:hypothetical protein